MRLYLFAHLRPGVTIEQAANLVNVPYHTLLADVEAPLQTGMSEQGMARFLAKDVTVIEGSRGQSSLHGDTSLPVTLLLVVTGIVLLVPDSSASAWPRLAARCPLRSTSPTRHPRGAPTDGGSASRDVGQAVGTGRRTGQAACQRR